MQSEEEPFWCSARAIAGGPAAIALLLQLGWQYDLFQTTRWFDVLMHLLGGAFLAVSLAGVAWRIGWMRRARRWTWTLGLIVFFIAIVWEIFEVHVGMVPNWTQSVSDTVSDVLYALLSCALVLRSLNASRQKSSGASAGGLRFFKR